MSSMNPARVSRPVRQTKQANNHLQLNHRSREVSLGVRRTARRNLGEGRNGGLGRRTSTALSFLRARRKGGRKEDRGGLGNRGAERRRPSCAPEAAHHRPPAAAPIAPASAGELRRWRTHCCRTIHRHRVPKRRGPAAWWERERGRWSRDGGGEASERNHRVRRAAMRRGTAPTGADPQRGSRAPPRRHAAPRRPSSATRCHAREIRNRTPPRHRRRRRLRIRRAGRSPPPS